jgi:crotonyl-CoA carboxylase/reductase
MAAYVIRPDRQGEPKYALVLEEVDVPEPGPGEVLIRVVAASINYNAVWAALGKPVSVFRFHGQPFHVPGSQAAGIVVRVGPAVHSWRPGDEVFVNPAQTCGQCAACNGLDPLACASLKVWGYETTPGACAEYALVQARQLLRKPATLEWAEAGAAASLFIAYRMLVRRAAMHAGQVVLIWGGAGGLGTMAVQLCRAAGATAIAVVSSEERAALCLSLGATAVIDRREFALGDQLNDQTDEIRRFGSKIRELTGGRDPDIVFEHVGAATFPASLIVCKRFGTIVTCGATTGFNLDVDARHLWMRQKSIIGCHLSNLHDAEEASRFLSDGRVRPIVSRTFAFEELPEAHQMMYENRHLGRLVVLVAPSAGQPASGFAQISSGATPQ